VRVEVGSGTFIARIRKADHRDVTTRLVKSFAYWEGL